MTNELKDVLKRSAWTFAQAFVAVFVIGITAVLNTLEVQGLDAAQAATISLASAAFAAALSAVKTVLLAKLK